MKCAQAGSFPTWISSVGENRLNWNLSAPPLLTIFTAELRRADVSYHKPERELTPMTGAVHCMAGAGAIVLIVGLAAIAAPRSAGALPAYAQQTHFACGRCHVSPAGGGERNAFGKAFAANGHKLPSGHKPAKTDATEVSPALSAGPGGGYYSSITNPRFGLMPDAAYSNSLFFRVDH
jgi:hypothetical protein